MLSAITFTIAAVSAQWNYPSTNPGCMQNPYAYGCQSGQFFPPQIPQIPQCLPTMVGCPGGPVFQGCNEQFGRYTPGCPMPMGGQVPIPGCTVGIAGCPGGPPIPGCPGGMIVPGCQFAPAVPGCPQGPIPAGCFPQIPYVRNFQAVNEFSASLVKNASDNSTTVVPTTGNSDPRAASTNGAVSASLSAVSFAAFLALF